MDSFELNKLIGAFLGVVFVLFSVSLVSGALFSSEAPEKPGYAIEAQEKAGGGEAEKEEEPQDIAPLLADADASKGENIFKRCHACHTIEQGGPNKVGPNLWGIVNRPPGSHEGFSYSSGMKKFAEEVKHWDYDHLNHFLTDPRGYISGTAMTFAGLSDIEDRANVIAFLRQHAETPEPLPEPKAEPASDEGQAAEGGEGGGEKAEDADQGGDNGAASSDEDASQDQSGDAQEQAPADGDEQAAPADDSGSGNATENGATENGATENGAAQDDATQDEGASGQAPAEDNEQAAPADDDQGSGSSGSDEAAPANDNEQPADDERKPASGE